MSARDAAAALGCAVAWINVFERTFLHLGQPAKWEPGAIRVTKNGGQHSEMVPGWRSPCGRWHVRRQTQNLDAGCARAWPWILTHVPTGAAVGGGMTRSEAAQRAEAWTLCVGPVQPDESDLDTARELLAPIVAGHV